MLVAECLALAAGVKQEQEQWSQQGFIAYRRYGFGAADFACMGMKCSMHRLFDELVPYMCQVFAWSGKKPMHFTVVLLLAGGTKFSLLCCTGYRWMQCGSLPNREGGPCLFLSLCGAVPLVQSPAGVGRLQTWSIAGVQLLVCIAFCS